MERRWVVAAFLDITGFRSWTYRASTAPEVKEQFILNFYRVLQCYVKHELNAWSKYEGDGILTIKEFTPAERKEKKEVVEFVSRLKCLYKRVVRMMEEVEDPPEGARIRLITGYVYKIMVLDPNDPERKRTIPEYLEYCTNTVRGLLEVNPELDCLATKGLVDNLGTKRSLFRVRPLGKPSCYPKGVNSEDIQTLQVLRFK